MPQIPSPLPGPSHGVLEDPICSSGTCPRRAQFPRSAARPAGRGTSAPSPARTCGSSPSSTSSSWTPPPTRPGTSGSSAWTWWVSPPRGTTPGHRDHPCTWVPSPCPPGAGSTLCLSRAGDARAGAAAGGEHHGTFPAGLIAPPVNVSARWAGATGQLHVSWQPPLPDYPNFFLYEVRYSAASPAGTPHGTAWDPGKQHTGDRDPPTHLSSSTHPPTARGAAASPRAGQVGTGAGGLGGHSGPPKASRLSCRGWCRPTPGWFSSTCGRG